MWAPLVASGRLSFGSAGTAKLKIRLTRAGKRLLRGSRRLKLAARSSFTPRGQAAVVVKKAFSLRR